MMFHHLKVAPSVKNCRQSGLPSSKKLFPVLSPCKTPTTSRRRSENSSYVHRNRNEWPGHASCCVKHSITGISMCLKLRCDQVPWFPSLRTIIVVSARRFCAWVHRGLKKGHEPYFVLSLRERNTKTGLCKTSEREIV